MTDDAELRARIQARVAARRAGDPSPDQDQDSPSIDANRRRRAAPGRASVPGGSHPRPAPGPGRRPASNGAQAPVEVGQAATSPHAPPNVADREDMSDLAGPRHSAGLGEDEPTKKSLRGRLRSRRTRREDDDVDEPPLLAAPDPELDTQWSIPRTAPTPTPIPAEQVQAPSIEPAPAKATGRHRPRPGAGSSATPKRSPAVPPRPRPGPAAPTTGPAAPTRGNADPSVPAADASGPAADAWGPAASPEFARFLEAAKPQAGDAETDDAETDDDAHSGPLRSVVRVLGLVLGTVLAFLLRRRRSIIVLAIAVLAAIALRMYVVEPYYIPSASMEPTLHGCPGCNDDHVLVDKLSYRTHDPHQSDIVVFKRPKDAHTVEDVLIKRVIALPGDHLQLRGGRVYINGKVLDEKYIRKACGTRASVPETSKSSWTIPNGDVFVMGDNRCDSMDSRTFGPIPQSSIVGRAFAIIWPFHRIKFL